MLRWLKHLTIEREENETVESILSLEKRTRTGMRHGVNYIADLFMCTYVGGWSDGLAEMVGANGS